MNKDELEKKSADSRRAGNIASLRAVVAGYLVYLGISLIHGMLTGESEMAPWVAWLCGIFFVLAGAAFGWYTWRRWRADTVQKPNRTEERQPED